MKMSESERWVGRIPPWTLAVGGVLLIIAAAVAFKGPPIPFHPDGAAPSARSDHAHTGSGQGTSRSARHTATPGSEGGLTIVSSVPAPGAQQVATDTKISVSFSEPISLGKVRPTLSPQIAGTWVVAGPDTLTYRLASPLIPGTAETIAVPGGAQGLRAKDGATLASSTSLRFGVTGGDLLRVQQLLAEEGYLPLSFVPSQRTVALSELARDQRGAFQWKWSTLPTQLTSQWSQGTTNVITTAAIESFQSQNGLGVDGQAGPALWAALINDDVNHKSDPTPYVYVLVNKALPENLTLWNNGKAQYAGVPVNTGASGADTTDGSFVVFEHVRYSDMKGTNPDGTTYNDPNVPYASYFNGGDALHGFIRATYGSPQSNGCVEMSYSDAALVWPLTPVGTLVTIEGPNYGSAPPSTTTTTTVPPAPPAPPATTTTAPPAPAPTPTTAPAPTPTTAPPPSPTTTTTTAPPTTTVSSVPATVPDIPATASSTPSPSAARMRDRRRGARASPCSFRSHRLAHHAVLLAQRALVTKAGALEHETRAVVQMG
jgi:peptidoglycan hydrolase-like protein with peptidoglycan-binding domain